MIRVRVVLFDLDGTLIDSGLDLANSVNYSLQKMGLAKKPVDLIRSFVGDGVRRLLERSLGEENLARVDEMQSHFAPHYEAHCTEFTRLYPGAREALEILQKIFPLGIITNKDRAFSLKILQGLDIDSCFDEVVGGDTLPNLKPAPDGIYHFAKRYDAKPSEIVMVGDHVTDLEMCERAGSPSIFCLFGMGKKGEFTPTHEISSFSELPSLLSPLSSRQPPQEGR